MTTEPQGCPIWLTLCLGGGGIPALGDVATLFASPDPIVHNTSDADTEERLQAGSRNQTPDHGLGGQ